MKDLLMIDARGLSCPQPVLLTRKALDENDECGLKVIVDNPGARENVSRFANNKGCRVSVAETSEGAFELTIDREGSAPAPERRPEPVVCQVADSVESKTVIYIGTDSMGRGDDALGSKLMRGFLRTVLDVTPLPWRIILINSGVRLSTADEEAVDALGVLRDRGVDVLSCGTCLQHFGLTESLRVGRVTNMYEVLESLKEATKVISPD